MKVEPAQPSADGSSRCWCTAEDLDDLRALEQWGSKALCLAGQVGLEDDSHRFWAIYRAFLPEEVALALSS